MQSSQYQAEGLIRIEPPIFPASFACATTNRTVRASHSLLAAVLALFCVAVRAGCTHRISAAYTTPLAAEMLGAHPDSGIPSMTDEISALSGCQIDVAVLPTARVWAQFDKAELELVLGAIQTEERDKVADFVPTLRIPLVLVTLKPSGSIPDRLEEFASHHLRVGLLRGVRLPADAQAVVEDLRRSGLIDEATDREEAYRKLEGGRDDAVLATVPPTDRPEHESLRVIVQSQFSPLVNGTYLRRAGFSPSELRTLHDAIVHAASDRDLAFRQQ